jgi:hypothetical protein
MSSFEDRKKVLKINLQEMKRLDLKYLPEEISF